MRLTLTFLTFIFGLTALQAFSLDSTFCYRQPDSVRHLSMLFAGDLMQHAPQIQYARQKNGEYNYEGYYEWIKPEIQRADVAFANLEVTISGRTPSGYPCFSAPDAYLQAVKNAGFDVLFTANNHCCDKGLVGVNRTIQMCDSLAIPHLGTYRNQEERDQTFPFLLEKNGFRIAMLNYTYGTNGIKVPAPAVVNLLDTVQMAIDIQKAQQMQPDAIIVVPHWGIEYETLPRKSMVQMAQWFFDHGVDYVVGGHPHVIQPIELRTDPVAGQQHLIAYSLGNLISDQSSLPKYGGMMLRLELEKNPDDGSVRISDCSYALTFVSRPQWSRQQDYHIYPVTIPDSLLNATELKCRDAYINLARPLLDKHNVGEVHEIDIYQK